MVGLEGFEGDPKEAVYDLEEASISERVVWP